MTKPPPRVSPGVRHEKKLVARGEPAQVGSTPRPAGERKIRDVVRFYVMEDCITKKRYALGRWSEEGGDLFLEALTREGKWFDCPYFLSAWGVGGNDMWEQVDAQEAQKIAGPGVEIWPVSSTPKPKVKKTTSRNLPEGRAR